jgi:hypothetical protein
MGLRDHAITAYCDQQAQEAARLDSITSQRMGTLQQRLRAWGQWVDVTELPYELDGLRFDVIVQDPEGPEPRFEVLLLRGCECGAELQSIVYHLHEVGQLLQEPVVHEASHETLTQREIES